MSIKAQGQDIKSQIEEIHAQAAMMREQNQLEDALLLYLKSIELDESQSQFIYADAISIATQLGNFDLAGKLIRKASKIHLNSVEVLRASGVFFQQTNHLERAIECYQKSIDLDSKQPEWIYQRLIDALNRLELNDRAIQVLEAAKREFPQLDLDAASAEIAEQTQRTKVQDAIERLSAREEMRETPKCIESNVDMSISKLRRKLTDSALVEQYSILLDQMLCKSDRDNKEIDINALLRCLAEIKTDIHYLKTKIINPPAEAVDPQAKQNVELEKIVGLSHPTVLKCDLKKRIVGSGWYNAEKFGRWSGPGTVSSLVFPYPVAGEYRFEAVVRGESKRHLLQTLKIYINDRELEAHISQKNQNLFPAIINADFTISPEQEQSFLAIDLVVGETVMPLETDSRLMGLLVEEISLIPNHSITSQNDEV